VERVAFLEVGAYAEGSRRRGRQHDGAHRRVCCQARGCLANRLRMCRGQRVQRLGPTESQLGHTGGDIESLDRHVHHVRSVRHGCTGLDVRPNPTDPDNERITAHLATLDTVSQERCRAVRALSHHRPPRSRLMTEIRPRHRRRLTAPAAVAVCTALVGTSALLTQATASPAEQVPVGAGSYTTELPPGASGPSDVTGAPVTPKVTPDFDQPVTTNEWWSSLIFQRYPDNPYGENLHAHPMTFKAQASGMEIGHSPTHQIVGEANKYEHDQSADLLLGVEGLNAPSARVAGYGDWTVTAELADGTRTLRTTIGQGLPFAYADVSGAAATAQFTSAPQVWHDDGAIVGVTVGDSHYALFAPSSISWQHSGSTFTAAGAEYVSVALLPESADLATFAPYAHSFVTGSELTYDYDPEAATLTSTYAVTTEAREGSQTGTLLALYPHHWKETTTELTDLRYASPRGPMRVVDGDRFVTELTTQGILPSLPTVDEADHDRLRSMIDAEINADDPWKGAVDTYWTGKALGRLAQLVPIADSIGYTAGRDALLDLLKSRLENWLTADGAGDDAQFYYDATWDTLIGY